MSDCPLCRVMCVRLLLEHHADFTLASKFARTPLSVAKGAYHDSCATLLQAAEVHTHTYTNHSITHLVTDLVTHLITHRAHTLFTPSVDDSAPSPLFSGLCA